MVMKKTEGGYIYHEPPYTRKEQREFDRRINNGGPITVVYSGPVGQRYKSPPPPPEEQHPPSGPPQDDQPSPARRR